MKKVYRVFFSIIIVLFLPSCIANPKYGTRTKVDISKLQWEEKNGRAGLPFAAAMNFCVREATDEAAKKAAVLFLEKKYKVGSALRVSEVASSNALKTSEMYKCMSGMGYRRKGS